MSASIDLAMCLRIAPIQWVASTALAFLAMMAMVLLVVVSSILSVNQT